MLGKSLIVGCFLLCCCGVSAAEDGVWWENSNPMVADSSQLDAQHSAVQAQPVGTAFNRFTSAVAAAGSLTVVTEVGDKTFFVAAMLATKYAKMPVFLGSLAALWLQTLGCAMVGSLFHHLPTRTSGWMAWPLDDYVAATLLFMFAIFHLKDGIWPTPEADDDSLHDLESRSGSLRHEKQVQTKVDNCLAESLLPIASTAASQATTPCSQPAPLRMSRRLSAGSARAIAEASAELSRSPTLTTKSSRKIFLKAFWLVTMAEFGDRSMFSTMALAASQNPYGVFIGASLGHTVVTLLAVSCALMLHQYLSERATNLLGGALFLMFGCLSLVEGLVRQGVVGDSFLSL